MVRISLDQFCSFVSPKYSSRFYISYQPPVSLLILIAGKHQNENVEFFLTVLPERMCDFIYINQYDNESTNNFSDRVMVALKNGRNYENIFISQIGNQNSLYKNILNTIKSNDVINIDIPIENGDGFDIFMSPYENRFVLYDSYLNIPDKEVMKQMKILQKQLINYKCIKVSELNDLGRIMTNLVARYENICDEQ